jgi:hypothetical protein
MGTPAVGQQINFTQVYNFFTGLNPGANSNIQLRGTLGALRQPAITSGPISLSANLGNQNVTYNVSASSGTASEGSTVTFSINTTYVTNGTILYYTLANVNTRDLDASNSTFANTSYTSSGASGYASIVNKAYLRLLGRYTDSGSIDYWVNNFLVNNYVSLSAFFGDLTGSAEYSGYQSTPTETGTVTVSSNSASKSFLIIPDYLTEGTESVTFQVRTGSHSGTLVGSAIVNLTDSYQDEGSPVINSFSASASTVSNNSTITLSWSTSNADIVRIYKNGSVYKAFNASTTSVSETITSNCTFTIYAWNGTYATTGSTLSINTFGDISITIGAGGAGGTDANSGSAGSSTSVTFQNITITANGGGGGGYNNSVGGSGGSGTGQSVTAGGSGAGASGDTGGGGGGGLGGNSAPATSNSGGNGAAAGTVASELSSRLNSQYGTSTAGAGYGSTSPGTVDNNHGNPGTGWGAGGGGANWYGGNGASGILGGGGGGAAGYVNLANRVGGNGGGGLVCVIRTTNGSVTQDFYTSTQTVSLPANTTAVTIYAIGGGGGGAGSTNSDGTSGGGGGAGGIASRNTW